MHFDECQFDYLAKYAYFDQKCRRNYCFFIFTNNPSYKPTIELKIKAYID